MKKTTFRITGFLFLFIAAVSLMACGSEETVTLQTEQNGVTMKITYVAKGDEVTEQSVENEMPYSSLMVETKEDAQTILDPLAEEFQDIEGVEHNIEYKDDVAIETMTVDYTTADLSKIAGLPGSTFEGDTDANKISLEQSVEMLESQGFEVVE